jgi:hypothetical protein
VQDILRIPVKSMIPGRNPKLGKSYEPILLFESFDTETAQHRHHRNPGKQGKEVVDDVVPKGRDRCVSWLRNNGKFFS